MLWGNEQQNLTRAVCPPYSQPRNLPWGGLQFDGCSARKEQNGCNEISQPTLPERTQRKEPCSAPRVCPQTRPSPNTGGARGSGVKAGNAAQLRAEWEHRCSQTQNGELHTSLLVFGGDLGGLQSHLSGSVSLQCYNTFPRTKEAHSRVGLWYQTRSELWDETQEQPPAIPQGAST